MGFLLLGTDSLIACIAVGPIISRRIALPFASVWFSTGEQTLSSAVQAGIGLLIAWGLVALFPVLKRQVSLAFAFCGVAILAAAGAMLAFPAAF